jgi:hypothetical protein
MYCDLKVGLWSWLIVGLVQTKQPLRGIILEAASSKQSPQGSLFEAASPWQLQTASSKQPFRISLLETASYKLPLRDSLAAPKQPPRGSTSRQPLRTTNVLAAISSTQPPRGNLLETAPSGQLHQNNREGDACGAASVRPAPILNCEQHHRNMRARHLHPQPAKKRTTWFSSRLAESM